MDGYEVFILFTAEEEVERQLGGSGEKEREKALIAASGLHWRILLTHFNAIAVSPFVFSVVD